MLGLRKTWHEIELLYMLKRSSLCDQCSSVKLLANKADADEPNRQS
jgi:hypothetical protein